MASKHNVLKICALAVLVMSTIVTLLPEFNYPVLAAEILEQFRLQVTLVFIILAVVMLFRKYYVIGFLQCSLVFYSIYIISTAYPISNTYNSCTYDENQQPLRVLNFNIYYKNPHFDDIFQTIERINADILIIQEAQAGFANTIHDVLAEEYPYYFPKVEKGEIIGVLLYSRYPIKTVESKILNNTEKRYLQAEIDVAGNVVDLIGIHATSPKSEQRIQERNAYFEELADIVEYVALDSQYFFISGDFNTVPWHKNMRAMSKRASLNHNTIAEFFGTWPTLGVPFMSVPIDHIFYNNGFYDASYYRGKASGSDHYPVYADLHFCDSFHRRLNE